MNSERADHDGTDAGDGRAARRPHRGALTASVAAAVLLAGGGGAYLAATASDGSGGSGASGGGTASAAPGDDGGTPPPLALDGYPAPSGGAVAYRARGALPDGPDAAPVYRAAGEVTKEEVARLARALGLDGAPVARGTAWTVGAVKDGSGPVLRVARQAPGTWSFQRYAPGTDDCAKGPVCATLPTAADPVGEATAKKAAAPVLAAVGQGDADLDAGQVIGAHRVVNADPEVGGLPTDNWTTGVTVGAGGEVVAGSGRVKAPVKGDTYPVLSAAKTLALMNTGDAGAAPGAGIGGCASPVPLDGRPGTGCGPAGARKETVTVERAEFGLAAHTVRGRPVLVPSWLFQTRAPGARAGSTVTHPAVDPEYLPSPAARPSEQREVKATGYTAAGRELTVTFTGGVCARYDVTADEGADEVTVTVTETSDPGKVCVLIAEEQELTVRLAKPLGDRAVVGPDGERIPLAGRGARLPEPGR
ncbi:hypothetical protein [Streptomyces fumanus]|uniref:Membrane protein n=1 Tax=Streptomyces fumanus TaxID=67302 RepID=A0A919A1D5_9ACTN|nr:hypothetical protein [Streptomyces fumanus]GHE82073.1 membrane protein [Streptomyces fumanus]